MRSSLWIAELLVLNTYSKNNRCKCDVAETVHELVIVRLSLMSGSVTGGDDMIILCEKVKKGVDIVLHDICFLFISDFNNVSKNYDGRL